MTAGRGRRGRRPAPAPHKACRVRSAAQGLWREACGVRPVAWGLWREACGPPASP